ncbi:hypothetical protein ACN9MB_13225 [Dyella kyungheensis]|uniref:hypothetical protein n=1 Tax=Dyella kyungheensis TaxID=1242174 RepID=UPI003CEF9A79
MKSEHRKDIGFHRGISAEDVGGEEALGRLIALATLLGKSTEQVAFEAATREFASRTDLKLHDAAICIRKLDAIHQPVVEG